MSPNRSPYSYDGQRFCLRQNRDGTVDSICVKCFATVSHDQRDIEMANAQLAHLDSCVPFGESRIKYTKRNVGNRTRRPHECASLT
jgi:hypothetical protein